MTSRIPRVIPASSHEGITDGIAAQPTEDSLWLGAEGVTTNSSVSRTVAIDPAHDTYIAGTAAVPNAQTTPSTNLPEGNSKMKSGVSLKDKIVGQAKIIQAGMRHDPVLAQEGEDLKNGDKHQLH